MIAIKINRVNKTSPLHPNMLLGKICELEYTSAKVVTEYGKITGLISTTKIYPCTTTNIKLDYTKELAFSAACKAAHANH